MNRKWISVRVPDLQVSCVWRTGPGISLDQQLKCLWQHLTEHFLGQLRWKNCPQVIAKPRQEVEPHLHREGTALTLWTKKVYRGKGVGDEDILWYRYRKKIWDKKVGEKETVREKHEGEEGERQRQVCQHQDVSVVTPPALCTWVSSPTGIWDCFKVLNWRTHHNRHTRTYKLTHTERQRGVENFSE